MGSYNVSISYDIDCDNCGKYFSDEEGVCCLDEIYTDLDWESGNLYTYYKCDNCESGEVMTIS